MINWKSTKHHIPTNANIRWSGAPDTPYISCLVWICNPKYINGGVMDVIRWDTENKCLYSPDMLKWFHYEPYEITHFCVSDEINIPTIEKANK